jgi:hypothetical protein
MKKIGVPSSKWDSIANLAFISAEVNKEISDTLPIEYVPKIGIAKSRFEEQLIPLDEKFWAAERFDEFLRLRAEMQATAVNSILGLEGNKLMDLEETSEEDNIDFSS